MEEKFSDCEKILSRLRNKAVGSEAADGNPEVSVIIPVFNDSDVIAETLDSVFAQTHENFEVILVNDGSNDTAELKKVLEPFESKLVYAEQDNLGCAAGRNSAICLSRGDYLAFLDGDDLWYPDFLKSQIEFLKQNELDMVYCDADLIGDSYYSEDTYMATAPSVGPVTPESLLSAKCNVIVSGTIVKRSCLEEFGMFDPASVRSQDFDVWIRLALNGVRIGYQKKVLMKYRVSADSLTGSIVARAERGVTIMNFVKNKYDLSRSQLDALEGHLAKCAAEVDLAKAKLSLVGEQFDEAALHLRNARSKSGQLKLTILMAMLGVAPRLVLLMFKKFRPREFSFISNSEL